MAKAKVLHSRESPRGESTATVFGVNYQLLAIILSKDPNGQFMVAVDHN